MSDRGTHCVPMSEHEPVYLLVSVLLRVRPRPTVPVRTSSGVLQLSRAFPKCVLRSKHWGECPQVCAQVLVRSSLFAATDGLYRLRRLRAWRVVCQHAPYLQFWDSLTVNDSCSRQPQVGVTTSANLSVSLRSICSCKPRAGIINIAGISNDLGQSYLSGQQATSSINNTRFGQLRSGICCVFVTSPFKA